MKIVLKKREYLESQGSKLKPLAMNKVVTINNITKTIQMPKKSQKEESHE